MLTVNNSSILLLKSLLLISSICGFSLLAMEHIRKHGHHGNFRKLIFRGIKTIYLIWSTLLSILCVQDTPLKVLLKVVNENLPLKLEGSFFIIKAKIVLR